MGRCRYGTGFAGSATYSRYALPPARALERQRAVGMEIQARRPGVVGRPHGVAAPAVRAGLERGGPPRGFLPSPVQVIPEEGRLDGLAVLARRFVAAQGDQPDAEIGRA